MVTKSCLFIPHTLPFSKIYFPPCIAGKPLFSRVFCTITTSSLTLSSSQYGPSLQKGHAPFPLEIPGESVTSLNEEVFTRVFDLSALRVPSDVCSTLENRLRGHLLNWPRIKNIARIPGDEIDEKFNTLLPKSNDEDSEKLAALNRRIHGKAEGDGEPLNAVLYRDKLARTFDSQGYVNFRNLAKISRPKKKKKKKERTSGDGKKCVVRGAGNGLALVEVVEDENEAGDGQDLSRLLGEDVRRPNWRGSTRLLLLDEQYANRTFDELPEAVKVVFQEYNGQSVKSEYQLVRCRLSLFYDYWQISEILEALLPNGIQVPSAFELVGHIAHLNLRDDLLQYKNLIAKVILDKTRPKIQTVVNKVDPIHNDYRTMQLEVLAGNNSLVTTVVENGLRFDVDLAAVYWNSRLSTERQRLLSCFTNSDVVCDVFAGVGPISISAAKKVKHVYANDLNPCAVDYLERNCVLNKLERKIEVFNMDGRRFIETVFASVKSQPITQVVMDLPKDAAEFLDAFRGIFQGSYPGECILPWIHVYGFSKAQDPEFDFHERIKTALAEEHFDIEMHRVRLVAPGKWMLCASFILPQKVAHSKQIQIQTRESGLAQ